jgi:hypothetical protein
MVKFLLMRWNFSDVNPVHSWAVWTVYEKNKKKRTGDRYAFFRKKLSKIINQFYLVGKPKIKVNGTVYLKVVFRVR